MIFYFSGTGNSRYAAERIGAMMDEKVIDMAKSHKDERFTFEVKDQEKIGFVFPVYYYGPPVIVKEFMTKLKISGNEDSYVFMVMTCGSSSGGADRYVSKILAEHGLEIKAFFSVPMVDNFIMGYDLSDEEDRENINKRAEERLDKIAKSILVKGVSDRKSSQFDQLLTSTVYPFYVRGRNTKKFFADERCISCYLCEEICPVQAIKMVDGRPVWVLNQCVHCVACINRCPVEAIQYGDATKKRRRYVHPSVGI